MINNNWFGLRLGSNNTNVKVLSANFDDELRIMVDFKDEDWPLAKDFYISSGQTVLVEIPTAEAILELEEQEPWPPKCWLVTVVASPVLVEFFVGC